MYINTQSEGAGNRPDWGLSDSSLNQLSYSLSDMSITILSVVLSQHWLNPLHASRDRRGTKDWCTNVLTPRNVGTHTYTCMHESKDTLIGLDTVTHIHLGTNTDTHTSTLAGRAMCCLAFCKCQKDSVQKCSQAPGRLHFINIQMSTASYYTGHCDRILTMAEMIGKWLRQWIVLSLCVQCVTVFVHFSVYVCICHCLWNYVCSRVFVFVCVLVLHAFKRL